MKKFRKDWKARAKNQKHKLQPLIQPTLIQKVPVSRLSGTRGGLCFSSLLRKGKIDFREVKLSWNRTGGARNESCILWADFCHCDPTFQKHIPGRYQQLKKTYVHSSDAQSGSPPPPDCRYHRHKLIVGISPHPIFRLIAFLC